MLPVGGAIMSNDDRQRRDRRIPATFPVRISTIEPERDPWTGRNYFRTSQDSCANLSRGGAFVHTTELLLPGRRVLIELQLPNGSQVEAVGRVAWTKRAVTSKRAQPDSGVGVEFLGGAADQLAALEDFINKADEATAEDRDH